MGARDLVDASRAPERVSAPLAALAERARAKLLAPNILSVEHWERLRGGALYAATPWVDWAKLLRRTFDVDILECANCGARLRVLGVVNDGTEARDILARLDIATDVPLVARARDPTDDCADLWDDEE